MQALCKVKCSAEKLHSSPPCAGPFFSSLRRPFLSCSTLYWGWVAVLPSAGCFPSSSLTWLWRHLGKEARVLSLTLALGCTAAPLVTLVLASPANGSIILLDPTCPLQRLQQNLFKEFVNVMCLLASHCPGTHFIPSSHHISVAKSSESVRPAQAHGLPHRPPVLPGSPPPPSFRAGPCPSAQSHVLSRRSMSSRAGPQSFQAGPPCPSTQAHVLPHRVSGATHEAAPPAPPLAPAARAQVSVVRSSSPSVSFFSVLQFSFFFTLKWVYWFIDLCV